MAVIVVSRLPLDGTGSAGQVQVLLHPSMIPISVSMYAVRVC